MNREIKFRVWDIENKKYLENEIMWSVVKIPQEMNPDSPPWLPFITMAIYSPKYFVQQFTGLKDKNGIEIYEGDIVEFINYTGEIWRDEVVFDFMPNGFNVGFTTKNGNQAGFEGEDFLYLDKSRVIGNIFETPELIK